MDIEMVESQRKAIEINKLFKDVFGDESGQKMIDHLEKVFIKREMYQPGMTLDQVAFRQGEASIVQKIITEVNRSL